MYVHYSDDPSDNRPIFIHQSEWQQRMLTRYGSEVCLLDATYNTTCYGLPLFVLSVPTKSGYVMAAAFLLADEQACSIVKALQIISEWCPGWKPKYIMSDYSEAQISAIESVFPGIYDIHCIALAYAISYFFTSNLLHVLFYFILVGNHCFAALHLLLTSFSKWFFFLFFVTGCYGWVLQLQSLHHLLCSGLLQLPVGLCVDVGRKLTNKYECSVVHRNLLNYCIFCCRCVSVFVQISSYSSLESSLDKLSAQGCVCVCVCVGCGDCNAGCTQNVACGGRGKIC